MAARGNLLRLLRRLLRLLLAMTKKGLFRSLPVEIIRESATVTERRPHDDHWPFVIKAWEFTGVNFIQVRATLSTS